MKCIYSKYFCKYHFDEGKNELLESLVCIHTTLEYSKCESYRKYFWFMFKIMVGFLFAIWSLIVGVGFSTNFQGGDYICGVACCVPLSIVMIAVCLTLGIKGYDLELSKEEVEQAYRDNEEYKELQLHNANEVTIMWEWREKHPFEERVRKALETKNSNDIAKLIQLILDKALNES